MSFPSFAMTQSSMVEREPATPACHSLRRAIARAGRQRRGSAVSSRAARRR